MICKELIPKLLEFEKTPSAADERPELRFKRIVSATSVYRKKKLPDGSPACRRCAGPLPKGRRTFCSNLCVSDTLIRCQPSTARQWVHMRDNGVCAACGLDTEALWKAYKDARWGELPHHEVDNLMRALGFRTDQEPWQADHVVPVIEGGGHCGLSGYRTLCTTCHSLETKALAGRRAIKRRNG